MITNLIVKLFVRLTGKPTEQLAAEWGWHYFVTRSPWRAYWRVLRGGAQSGRPD